MKSLDKDEVVDFDESITFNTDMSEVNDVSFMKTVPKLGWREETNFLFLCV